MFKVSLLPDSYRRRLQNRDKIDIVSKIALVILVCLFIVYGGVAIKNQVLNSKLKKLQAQKRQLESKFPELEEYQRIYDDLVSARNIVNSITPSDKDAVEFFTIISNQTPDYVEIKQIDLENWFTQGICTLTCTVQDYQDLKDYESLFKTEEMQKTVKQIEVTSIERTVGADGEKSVNFTMVLSMANAIEIPTNAPQYVTVTDAKGEAVTNDDGEVATTDVANTTAASGEATSGGAASSETTTGEG